MRFTAAVLTFSLCLCGGVALASGRLTQTAADRAAQYYADQTVEAWDEAYDPTAASDGDPGAAVYIQAYALDPCDLSGRHGDCDVTYFLNDGDTCDQNISVRALRRGRAHATADDPVCDSDPE